MATLYTTTVVSRQVLMELGAARLKEAKVLANANCYAAAIYLGGYAVECYLKAAICKTLDCDGLPATYMSHNLDALLLHAGLKRKMEVVPQVETSFKEIRGLWVMEGAAAVRYRSPDAFKASDTKKFFKWVSGRNGVVPWLQRQV